MLKVKALRPSKHYFPYDIMSSDEGQTFMIAVNVKIEEETYDI
jgi:hypothetical protein